MTDPEQSRLDPAVVASLYVKHAGELQNFLHGVLRDGELAGEVLQATFARVVEQGHTARPETFKGWLFRVAYTEALLFRRRQSVHDRLNREMAADSSRQRDHDRPDDQLHRHEVVVRVQKALDVLPPEQRTVVRMRIYDGKKFAQIAEELGVPLGTVLTRMRSALEKLRRALPAEDRPE